MHFDRGHSTTTWKRREGGGSAKSPRLSTQGGVLNGHVDKNLKKKGIEDSWQMTMKSLNTSSFVQL